MRPSLGLLLLLATLAGCADGGGNAPGEDTPAFDELRLEATSTTGVIRGVVVDPAIQPVADALVTLASGGETRSSETGLFGFDGVAPGTQFVTVSKLGYRPTQQSIDVVAGEAEPRIVKVLLERDPSTTPFVVQHHYTGFISCSFKTANVVWDAESCDPENVLGYRDRDDSAPFFLVDAQPLYYQSEMIWKASQTFSEQLVTIQYACDEPKCSETATNRLCNVRGPSPLVCRVDHEQSHDGGGGGHGIVESGLGTDVMGYSVEMFANCNPCVPGTVLGFGLALDQPFDVYNHLFYGYKPPEGWLFVEASEVPGPP